MLTAYACGSLVANRTEHAREALRSLEKLYPGEKMSILLQASIAAREGKGKEAVALLVNNANRLAVMKVQGQTAGAKNSAQRQRSQYTAVGRPWS